MAQGERIESGIQALIDRLQGEGVDVGRREAARLEVEARRRAELIVAEAEERAASLIVEARRQSEAEERAARSAIQLAYRDTLLLLQESLVSELAQRLQQLVASELERDGVLVLLIHEVVRGAVRELGQLTGATLLAAAEGDADAGSSEARLVALLAEDVLASGVTLRVAPAATGVRLTMREGAVELDLSPTTIAKMILGRITPRLRSVLTDS